MIWFIVLNILGSLMSLALLSIIPPWFLFLFMNVGPNSFDPNKVINRRMIANALNTNSSPK